jgi:hypothetical protein
VIPAGRPRPTVFAPAGHPLRWKEPVRAPDLWDTNPDNVLSPPDAQPDPATRDHETYTQEIRLKDDRGRLRLPAYVLIALGIAVVALTVAILAVLVGFT